MSIKYKAIQKTNPRKPEAEKLYYPTAVSSGKVGVAEIARRISDKSTTVSDIDAQAVIMALTKELAAAVRAGETVDLGDFGSFRITLHGKGKADAKEVSREDIKEVNIRFTAGKGVETSLSSIEFEKVA